MAWLPVVSSGTGHNRAASTSPDIRAAGQSRAVSASSDCAAVGAQQEWKAPHSTGGAMHMEWASSLTVRMWPPPCPPVTAGLCGMKHTLPPAHFASPIITSLGQNSSAGDTLAPYLTGRAGAWGGHTAWTSGSGPVAPAHGPRSGILAWELRPHGCGALPQGRRPPCGVSPCWSRDPPASALPPACRPAGRRRLSPAEGREDQVQL